VRYLDGPRPRLFAHRGASGTHPENTLPAFAAGLAAGADRLELDVHATRDGEIVVLHDARVDRTTDGHGEVRRLTLEAVKRLDAGHGFASPDGSHPHRGRGIRIPTLAELLAAHPDVPLNIEIKQADPPIVERVLQVLDDHVARERTLLAAEDGGLMTRIRAAAPDMLTSHSAPEVADFVYRLRDGRLQGYRPPGVAFQVPPSHGDVVIVTAESVRVAHDLGVEVHVWTINDASRMEALLALGVDGLMTDVPAVAARLLGR
jgi:glycerophosphoryl diester phosphodiesterase